MTEPVVIVSNDTHIGPRLIEDLRDYCPAKYRDEFDRFAASTVAEREAQPPCSRAAATSTTPTSGLPVTTTRRHASSTRTTTG